MEHSIAYLLIFIYPFQPFGGRDALKLTDEKMKMGGCLNQGQLR
jgi:hypothetical protein